MAGSQKTSNRKQRRILTGEEQISSYMAAVARANGVQNVSQKFSVIPTLFQQLLKEIQESTEFMQRINHFTVNNLKTGKLYSDLGSPITKRTKVTDTVKRKALVGSSEYPLEIELTRYEHDIRTDWDKIDEYASFPNFRQILQELKITKIACDRMFIAWNGTSRADNTDPANDLKDVDIGWPEQLRIANPSNYVSEGQIAGSGRVTIGKFKTVTNKGDWADATAYVVGDAVVSDSTQFFCIKTHTSASGTPAVAAPTVAAPTANWTFRPDFKNLSQAAADIKFMIPPRLRNGNNLVLMVGEGIVQHEESKIFGEWGDIPSESKDIIQLTKSYGGLPAYMVPFFPSDSICVTTWKNLSWYTQKNSLRRYLVNDPNELALIDYNSLNAMPAVENFDLMAFYTNIEYIDIDDIDYALTAS